MADSKLQLIEVLRVRTSLHQHPLHFNWSGTDIDIYSSSYSFPLSVQLSRSVVCDSLWCHVPQYGRLPCPLITARVCSTHVHRVGDAIQPSHPLSSLLLPPSVFPSIRIFSNESVLRIRWPKYRSFSISPSNEYSGLISFRIDWFDLLPCCPRDSQESSPRPQFKGINSSAAGFLYSPTLTSIHDYWENP